MLLLFIILTQSYYFLLLHNFLVTHVTYSVIFPEQRQVKCIAIFEIRILFYMLAHAVCLCNMVVYAHSEVIIIKYQNTYRTKVYINIHADTDHARGTFYYFLFYNIILLIINS